MKKATIVEWWKTDDEVFEITEDEYNDLNNDEGD